MIVQEETNSTVRQGESEAPQLEVPYRISYIVFTVLVVVSIGAAGWTVFQRTTVKCRIEPLGSIISKVLQYGHLFG